LWNRRPDVELLARAAPDHFTALRAMPCEKTSSQIAIASGTESSFTVVA